MKLMTLTFSMLLVGTLTMSYSQEEASRVGDEEMETIAAGATPTEQWVRRYNPGYGPDFAQAIKVDSHGNVYVTGLGEGDEYDYVTIKYNSAGVQQWLARYHHHDDQVRALALDDSGNVYVTGFSKGIKYLGDYVTYLADYATVKYNSQGLQQWVARYNGAANHIDEANAIAVDARGNVYVTGFSVAANGHEDYVTIKYNGAGVKQWAARYNGLKNRKDVATALVIDQESNVYVAGSSWGINGSFGSFDYAIIKYNTDGVKQWVARYNGPLNGTDEVSALALDQAGNVYVTGKSSGHNLYDYVTLKYNNAGIRQWIARYDGPQNQNDLAKAIALDDSGNVYVTGHSNNIEKGVLGNSTNYDYVTIKYDKDGNRRWSRRYEGRPKWPGRRDDGANALALDGMTNVYVTGFSSDSSGFLDYATVKYDRAGNQQWIIRYNGPANRHDDAKAVAVDAAGNVFVTGYSAGTGPYSYYNYATIKYSQTSNTITTLSGDEEHKNGAKTTRPTTFDLAQNFPNPFNPNTTIRLALPTAGKVRLTIYNVRGELVRTIVDNELTAGYHTLTFDAGHLASGIYFYRMEAETYAMTRKMILQK